MPAAARPPLEVLVPERLRASGPGGRSALREEARRLEEAGRWGEALRRYQALREAEGAAEGADAALEAALERCRRHLRIEARCRSAADRRFARYLGVGRGLALYEEVLRRIRRNYVSEVPLSQAVLWGLENCRVAPRDGVFAATYRSPADGTGPLARWEERLDALRARLERADDLSPGGGAEALREVLAANLCTLRLPEGVLVMEMVHGAVERLDRYSAFLNPDRLEALREEIDGEFVGLGVRIALRGGEPVVVDAIPGGPAARAGVQAGDRVLAVAGRPTGGMSLEEVARLMHGPLGSTVTLAVRHPGEREAVLLAVRRERVLIRSVSAPRRLGRDGSIGYVRLSAFQKGTAGELARALEELESRGIRALVLDMRGNPGGVLESAVEVADGFLRRVVVVTTRGRAWTENRTFRARAEGTRPPWPMVVLVDGMSASATEIVAAALRCHRRAVLIGARTYGKGSVQSLFTLGRGEAGLRLTTAHFYAPSGRCLEGKGLVPDVEVAPGRAPGGPERSADPDGTDRQLARAVRYLEEETAPPAGELAEAAGKQRKSTVAY